MYVPGMSERAETRAGAFFGRRKGHALKPRQAALFDTLLPQLALDLTAPAPADLRALFDGVDEVRLESGFGGGEHLIAEAERHPRHGLHRHRAVHQRHGQGAGRDRRAQARQHPAASRRRDRHAGVASGAQPRALRSALSRSVAEAAALEAPLRAGQERRRRSRGALRPGGEFRFASDIPDYVAWTLMRLLRSPDFVWTAERADDWRQAVAGLHRHALRGQGHARRPRALLSDFQSGR